MTKTVKLTPDNFMEQIVRYGYFGSQIPKCFSSDGLFDSINSLLKLVSTAKRQTKYGNKNATSPVNISTYKNGVTRRMLSLPNPEAFLRLVKLFKENWDIIVSYASSDNSLSPITYLRDYNDDLVEEINSEELKEKQKAKSDYIDGIKKSIMESLGYQYQLRVDVANCYNTIYTHSIAWSMCGKEKAKQYLKTNTPEEIKAIYGLADRIDAFMRFQKNNETNGIIVGPYTSRIFSEILLTGIDKELAEADFVFKRYVDDFKFYFRSESEAVQSVQKIERILNKYNLSLNAAKTEIQRFPYEYISNIKETYDVAFSRNGIFGVLNEASIFHGYGEKGAYKYALKYISDKKIERKEFEFVCPLLINILLLDPKYGRYVVSFLKKNKKNIDTEALGIIINKELSTSIQEKLQQETLLFLYLIHEIRIYVDGENIKSIVQNGDDFSRIMALDIWKRHKTIVKRNRSEAKEINKARRELSKMLETETYHGEHWLLLYEVVQRDLLKDCDFINPEENDFIKALRKNNVSFYE